MMLAMPGLMAGNAYQNAYVDGDDSSVEDPATNENATRTHTLTEVIAA